MSYKVHKVKNIKFRIVLMLAAVCCLLSTAPSALAQSVSLGVYPPIMQIEATPPANVKSTFSLQNPGDESIVVNFVFKAFKSSQSNDGQVDILDTFENLPDPLLINRIKIKEASKQIKSTTLSPKQKKTLDFEINIPKNEAHGDYYFTVLFITQPQSSITTNSSLASAGVAMNVLLSVGPKEEAKGYIKTFKAPFFVDSGPLPFTIGIVNTGTNYIVAKGEIIIENFLGQKVGKVSLLPVNVLSNSERLIPDEKQTYFKSDSPVAVWPEKFLIGPYKATLSIKLSENGTTYVRSIRFFAFPARYLLAILAILGITVFIILRVKRKID